MNVGWRECASDQKEKRFELVGCWSCKQARKQAEQAKQAQHSMLAAVSKQNLYPRNAGFEHQTRATHGD